MLVNGLPVRSFHRRIQLVACDCTHHDQWAIDIGIQGKKRQDGVQQIRDLQAICAQHTLSVGFPWKVRIGQYNFISMPHAVQDCQ